jgi:preprotein translocase subunit SecG
MVEILFTIFHVLVCLLLVVTVLLQAGKGGGLAGSIGGGMSSASVLGGRTATTFLSKATTILATAFMISCLVQSIAFQTAETGRTTATQRMMEEGGLPIIPAPLGDVTSLLEEPAATEATPAAEGSAETQ